MFSWSSTAPFLPGTSATFQVDGVVGLICATTAVSNTAYLVANAACLATATKMISNETNFSIVVPSMAVSVVKTQTGGEGVGSPVQYQIAITNTGAVVIDDMVVVDTLSPVGRLIPASGRERVEVRTWEALADGLPVDAAASDARQAVSLAVPNTVEWGTPVLHMRAPDGTLFHVDMAGKRGVVRHDDVAAELAVQVSTRLVPCPVALLSVTLMVSSASNSASVVVCTVNVLVMSP